MKRIIAVALLILPVCALADDLLPKPDHQRQPSDPAWLAQLVQFHGHLGPAAVAGARMGMIGLRAVEAKGYFDVEVQCEGPMAKPPQACFLDGVQTATGATLGKRNLTWIQADQIALRIKNTRTGKAVELRPTPALVELLAPPKSGPRDDVRLEAVARKIAALPEQEIARVTPAAAPAAARSTAHKSEVIRFEDVPAHQADWGEMRRYLTGETFGAKDVLTAVAIVKPGKSVHRAHRHAQEEYLIVAEGSGTWSLRGKEFPAQRGDILYVEPWVYHGLTNTGDEQLTFVVVRYNGKGIPIPPRPDNRPDEQ